MKHFIIKNGCKVVCISAIALSSLSSCMKDDLTNCPAPKVSLKFDYTYNVENADAFSQEVKTSTSMFSIKTVNTSIPIRSQPTNSKRVTAWTSQTYRKVNTPSSA